jgi:DNA end-binding protein Ku
MTLVEKLSSKSLDLTDYSDSYTKELRSLVAAKTKGKPIAVKHESKQKASPTDLISALKASMQVEKSKK